MPFPTDNRLGRLATVETERAKALWPVSRALPDEVAQLPDVVEWARGPIRDQGQTPQCVGYSGWGWEFTGANQGAHDDSEPDGPTLYGEAQVLDGMALPHDGTTVVALMKALQARGEIGAYLWATALNDVINWLSLKGPVIVGVNWYDQMFTPDAAGFVTLGGNVAGGHAFLLYGVNNVERYVMAQNSWGTSWGLTGTFKIAFADLQRLLFAESGECACALQPSEPVPPPAPPTPPAPVVVTGPSYPINTNLLPDGFDVGLIRIRQLEIARNATRTFKQAFGDPADMHRAVDDGWVE